MAPDTMILVFPMLTHRPFFSIPNFHAWTFTSSSSKGSAMATMSSTYSSSHGQPVQNSRDSTSSNMMKNRGLRIEPWCTPTPTPHHCNLLLLALYSSLQYVDCTTRTSHSSIPGLRQRPPDDDPRDAVEGLLQVHECHVEGLVGHQVLLL